VLLSAFDWGGKRVLQATVRDISLRKQSENALKESNDRFLTFIKEAAMRLKNPLEVVEENLAIVLNDIEHGELECTNASLQLMIQIKNLEQIRKNIIELNTVIVDRSGEMSEASKQFLTG
jgi:two-component sensor histidine kinase